MCNFFSCCVDKKGKVYWEPGINNHHEIVEIFKLNDNTDNQLELKFARVEITPKDGDIFNKNIDNWGLRIDENIIPEWFSPMHEKQCLSTLEKCLADCVFSDITIAEIKDKKGLYLKNVVVQRMYGSSVVQEMYDSSVVQEMYDSSVVQRMYGSSVVQEMYDSSTCMIYSKNASFTIKSEFSVVICRINNNIIIHKGENYGS
jgi:hypothetical protein